MADDLLHHSAANHCWPCRVTSHFFDRVLQVKSVVCNVLQQPHVLFVLCTLPLIQLNDRTVSVDLVLERPTYILASRHWASPRIRYAPDGPLRERPRLQQVSVHTNELARVALECHMQLLSHGLCTHCRTSRLPRWPISFRPPAAQRRTSQQATSSVPAPPPQLTRTGPATTCSQFRDRASPASTSRACLSLSGLSVNARIGRPQLTLGCDIRHEQHLVLVRCQVRQYGPESPSSTTSNTSKCHQFGVKYFVPAPDFVWLILLTPRPTQSPPGQP